MRRRPVRLYSSNWAHVSYGRVRVGEVGAYEDGVGFGDDMGDVFAEETAEPAFPIGLFYDVAFSGGGNDS